MYEHTLNLLLFHQSIGIAFFFAQTSAKEPREPVLAQVRHIGLPTKGDSISGYLCG